MNVNTSTNVYSYVQNTSGNVSDINSSQPVAENSTAETISNSSSQSTISGQGLMMSRLFGNTNSIPPVETQLTKTTDTMDPVRFLTLDDRNTLSSLYAQAQSQGTDLRYVDDLARDLRNYRKFGSVEASFNDGQTYDNGGHVQSVAFTEKDSATASRILNSGNVNSSVLDPSFLKYELDPGYSFSHAANFNYLESVVNGSGTAVSGTADQNKTSQFSTYEAQGLNNYVVSTSSEVTLKSEEPDFIDNNGVFTVTETGKKHGFRLQGGQVVQDKVGVDTDTQSLSTGTLLDDFVNKQNTTDRPTSFFEYLFSSKLSNKNQG